MWLVRLLLRPLAVTIVLLSRLLLWCSSEKCGGLRIMDRPTWDDDPPAEFRDQIERAMQLIQERNPRRAKWITASLDYIVNTKAAGSGGAYVHPVRACYLDYASYRNAIAGYEDITPRAQQVLTIELARVIVHEATHGRIQQKGIEYNERHRERIERFCRRQEVQFLNRAAPGFRDLLGKPVDWESVGDFESIKDWYHGYWRTSRFDRFRQFSQNMADEFRGDSREGEPAATWRDQHRRLWQAAEAFHPWTEAMLRFRAFYRVKANNFAEADEDYRVVATLQPDDALLHKLLAISAYNNDRYQEALDRWPIPNEPDDGRTARWTCKCLIMLDRHEEALQWYEKGADRSDNYSFLTGRAWRLIELGRYEEALRDFDDAWDERVIEFGADEFTNRAVQAWLLRELGAQERFRDTRDELYAARDWWCQCCEVEPATIRAWVLPTWDELSCPGILSCGAYLLICTDELPPFDWQGFMESLAAEILASKSSNDRGYTNSYLRSLLAWNDKYPWREVPDDLTDGRQVYVVDMTLDRLFLPGGFLQGPTVTCWFAKTPEGYKAALAETSDASSEDPRHDATTASPQRAQDECLTDFLR